MNKTIDYAWRANILRSIQALPKTVEDRIREDHGEPDPVRMVPILAKAHALQLEYMEKFELSMTDTLVANGLSREAAATSALSFMAQVLAKRVEVS